MSDLIIPASPVPVALPAARVPITIRPGVLSDVPFLDSLQEMHTKQVGWMPTKQLEGKIKLGHVLVAEEVRTEDSGLRTELNSLSPQSSALSPIGYCIGNDQYFKRDDVGIIYQLNIVPMKQRGLIGATLLKAMFEQAAWGCKLFCCWCAQDIEANRFWEAMGFVPLAFRAGSAKKSRVHIFWQKRIRAGDTTTPYWFPSQTTGGSIREDRIVLPIPPGTHWKDAKPIVLPGREFSAPDEAKKLPVARKSRETKPKVEPAKPAGLVNGGLRFAPPKPVNAEAPAEKPKREPRPKAKNDPKLVAAARELRDRWIEEVNSGRYLPEMQGKYDVSRMIEEVQKSECRMQNERLELHSALSPQRSALPFPAPALPAPVAA